MAKVLVVGAQLDMTAGQLNEMRQQIEDALPGRKVVVVPGMTGGPFEADVKLPAAPFVEFSDPVASLW